MRFRVQGQTNLQQHSHEQVPSAVGYGSVCHEVGPNCATQACRQLRWKLRAAGRCKPQGAGGDGHVSAYAHGCRLRLAHRSSLPSHQRQHMTASHSTRFREPSRQPGFGKHFAQHVDRRKFPMCRWAKVRFQWMSVTPVRPSLFKRSWIEVTPSSGRLRFGLGCWVCRQAGGEMGAFGACGVRRPSKARLVRHRQSARHKRSVQLFLHHRGLEAGDAGGAGLAAPPVEEFAQLLQRIRQNELEATSPGARRKCTTMSWCLYEAQREKERKFLAKAVCLSLAQDASTRGPLLLTRYVACGPNLERASGILRVADGKKISGAEDLAKSVFRGLRAMATARRPHFRDVRASAPGEKVETLGRTPRLHYGGVCGRRGR